MLIVIQGQILVISSTILILVLLSMSFIYVMLFIYVFMLCYSFMFLCYVIHLCFYVMFDRRKDDSFNLYILSQEIILSILSNGLII